MADVTSYLSDEVTEVWIDFTYEGRDYTVNNQVGEYWFFANEPVAHQYALADVADRLAKMLED